MTQVEYEPIAIVGIGCRFPGGINTPDVLWRFLVEGQHVITNIPPERVSTNYSLFPGTLKEITTRQGGFLEHVDQFDADFFGISPREAERMDPQQRLLLEVAWEALEDAGQVPGALVGSRTGVFIGLWLNDYETYVFHDPHELDFHMTTGSGRYSASGRLSYFFGLQGPSITIDTACSSSLVAVHLGCQSLQSGESHTVLAGGVNIILRPHISIAYSRSKMIAADGLCKFGDSRADGYVRGEGAGIVVLKRLSQALADNDSIYAIIRGYATNNDGHSNGYLVTPSQQGQEALLRLAYESANINFNRVNYIEAHGSGTRAGDPVELGALAQVIGNGRSAGDPCFVGSVKTNLGHTEGAAGVTGLIKAALILKHHTVPASLHLQEPNPQVPWETGALAIPTQPTPLPAAPGEGVAGVSSFGITGTNAHVILTEVPPPPAKEAQIHESDRAYLLPLSAHTDAALTAVAQAYRTWFSTADAPDLQDICYTAGCRRTHHGKRLALVAHNKHEMLTQLDAFLSGDQPVPVVNGIGPSEFRPKVVFVFPGQGSQWVGMGRELMVREPLFRETLAKCEEAMQPFVSWSLQTQLTIDPESPDYRLSEIDVIQPVLISIEIALATLWRSWGIEPDAVIGHSMGEVGAAFVAGALSLTEAMQVICLRSKLLRRVAGQGAMAVVELSLSEAQAAVAGFEDSVCVAVNNSPRMCVLSGAVEPLETIVTNLQAQDVYCRFVKVDVASHSPQVDPLIPELLVHLEGLQPHAGTVPIYSTALGVVTDGSSYDATYWSANLRQPVLFSQMVQHLAADGHNVFIEMSPHPILLPSVQQGLQDTKQVGVTLPSMRRNDPEQACLMISLGSLYMLGHQVQWEKLGVEKGKLVKLPLYPWQRQSYWFTPKTLQNVPRASARRDSAFLLGECIAAADGSYLWQSELSLALVPYLADHQVRDTAVLPAALYLEMAMMAVVEAFGAGTYTLERAVFQEMLMLDENQTRMVQLVITPDGPGILSFRFFSHPISEVGAQTWHLHAEGIIRQVQSDLNTSPIPIAPQLLQVPTAAVVSSTQHYEMMHARGLIYGPHFQGIVKLWQTDPDHATAELQHADSLILRDSRYTMNPALLDACFQLLIATIGDDSHPNDTFLPVSLEKLHIYAQPQYDERLFGRAVVQMQTMDLLTGDVSLVDEHGQVLLAAYGLQMQRVPQKNVENRDDLFYQVQWQQQPPSKHETFVPSPDKTWLIFADSTGVADALARRLQDQEVASIMVWAGSSYQKLAPGQYQIKATDPDAFQKLFTDVLKDGKTIGQIVHLWSLVPPPVNEIDQAYLASVQDLGCISTLHLVQAIQEKQIRPDPRLWLITRGVHTVDGQPDPIAIAQAPLWGLGSGIVNEYPDLHCTCIDLSPVEPVHEIEALLAEMRPDAPIEQIALREDMRYVARLARFLPQQTAHKPTDVVNIESTPGQAYCLETTMPGILDKLSLHTATRKQPGPNQVEIEVYASGLNFIDVMKAMGVYPGLDPHQPVTLGAECSGRITAVGEGVVSFQVGDEVIAITPDFDAVGMFRAYATVPATLVLPKPADLTHEQAATIPITFLTAYYALHYLGRLREGERVLIHSAAGGVGLAAVQLAQLAGAHVLATAGTAEKRAYLQTVGVQTVMDSRSLAFGADVMAHTDGRGVDVVLNSLTGAAMRQSLSVLSPYGRFLEIGKQDIYQNNHLGLEPFKKNLSFFAIDLARLIKERPAFAMNLLHEIIPLFAAGKLHPLPMKTFSIAEASDAFRHLAQGKHIGKVVMTRPEQPVSLVTSELPSVSVRPNSSYLITGGLGGLGLTTAQWLADQGADTLILIGRSAPSAKAQKVIEKLGSSGTRIVTLAADVAQFEEIAAALEQVIEDLPPLRGVIHAAGVLDDALLKHLDQTQFKRVTAPKLYGAWNLHALTEDKPLDFFVLFSSAATLLGLPGQANYLAGNAFLDALAHYRQAQGRPGLSINWGPWSEVGLAAAKDIRGERLLARGLGSITPQTGSASLALLLQQADAQVAVMPFNWKQWATSMPIAAELPFFQKLAGMELPDTLESPHTLQDMLADQPIAEKSIILEAYLCEQISQVLRLAPAAISTNKSFKTLGLDSLMALELRNRLETSLDLRLSTTIIFNYPTVKSLTQYLMEQIVTTDHEVAHQNSTTLVTATFEADSSQETVIESSIDDLSDDELDLLLDDEMKAIDDLLKSV